MKKSRLLFKITALLMLAVIALTSLLSCSKPPELAVIKIEIERLVNASHEVNSILFGKGLPVDERLSSPYANYKCVSFETGIFKIDDIKALAESVYTKGYLEPIYEVTLEGKYDQVSGSVVKARYMESEGYLLIHAPENDDGKDPNNILGESTRSYDFSTIKIIKPSRADFVTFTIMSSKDGVSEEITLAVELTDVGWRLDYPTY